MFHHVKDLQFNARVSKPDPRFANLLLEQFGGETGSWPRPCSILPRPSVPNCRTRISTIC
jgi:hypothetical protein